MRHRAAAGGWHWLEGKADSPLASPLQLQLPSSQFGLADDDARVMLFSKKGNTH
jgi:hypothetical protein